MKAYVAQLVPRRASLGAFHWFYLLFCLFFLFVLKVTHLPLFPHLLRLENVNHARRDESEVETYRPDIVCAVLC